jgi:hypothetical protein
VEEMIQMRLRREELEQGELARKGGAMAKRVPPG